MIRLMLIGFTLLIGLNAMAAAHHMAQKLHARAAQMEAR